MRHYKNFAIFLGSLVVILIGLSIASKYRHLSTPDTKKADFRICMPVDFTIDDGTCLRLGTVPHIRAEVSRPEENKLCLDIWRDRDGLIINREVDNLFLETVAGNKEMRFFNEGHVFDIYVRHLGDTTP